MDGTKPCDTVIKIAKGLPYRDFVTVGLLVNKLNLKNETNKTTLGNIVPDCWIYVQDKGVKAWQNTDIQQLVALYGGKA